MSDEHADFDDLRSGEPDMRHKRLLFQCLHRRTQESDLIRGSFAETSLTGFDSAQLDRFEALLDCADADLFDWMIAGGAPPPQHDHDGCGCSAISASGPAEHESNTGSQPPRATTQESLTMERPLSPFMFPTPCRFPFTSVLSILHRFTGVMLSVGSILLTWWLVAAVVGGSLAPLIGARLSRETRGADLTSPARKPYSSMVSMSQTIAE